MPFNAVFINSIIKYVIAIEIVIAYITIIRVI